MTDKDIEELINSLKAKAIRLKRSKLDDEEEYGMGKLTLSELRFRADKHDTEIAEAQAEIKRLEEELLGSASSQGKKFEVFISYSSKDIDTARLLAALLEKDSFTVWRDEERLKAGAAFTVQLERALLRADVVVLLVSQASKESQWVRNETLFALDARKEIIPLMLEDRISLPFEIYSTQYIKAFKDLQAAYAQLKERISELAGMILSAPTVPATTFVAKTQKLSLDIEADVNPFLYGSAVPSDYFVGRDSAINEVRTRLGAVELQSISIVANRRMGKTSLLNFVKERHTTFLNPRRHWVVVYVDMMDARAHTISDLMQLLRRGIAEQIGKEPWAEQYDGKLAVLSACFEELAKSGYRLILCLDEWEKVMAYPELDSFIDALRSAGQRSWIAMITSTARTLFDLYQGGGLSSEFYNIFSITYLGLMLDTEWQQIITTGFARSGLEPLENELRTVRDLAGGHPYLTQLAGALIWEARRSRWTDSDVWNRFYEHARPLFSSILQRHTKEQNQALQIILGKKPDVGIAPNVLYELKNRGVLNSDGNIFSVPFADFLTNHSN